MTDEWPIDDAKNVATFTSRRIVSGEDWIYYVGHDDDDGGRAKPVWKGETSLEDVFCATTGDHGRLLVCHVDAPKPLS